MTHVTDDNFLLMFLRTRKYSFDVTAKSFENHFLLRKKHPEWFDVNPSSIEVLKSLVRCGYIYLLKDRDSLGQAVFLLNGAKFDTAKYNGDISFHVTYSTPLVGIEDEVTQLTGFTYILNYTNATMSLFSLYSIPDIIDWIKSAGSMPGRFKKFIIIGLPPFTNALFNVVKMAMSEKQRDRLFILNNYDELCQHVDPSILPDTVGGKQSEEKIIESFIQAIDDNIEKLKSSNDFKIDETKAVLQNDVDVTVGSFRKLDID
jgi:hypothetical protein